MFRLPLSKDFGNANLDTGLSCAKARDIAPTDSSHQTLVGEAGVRASRRFYRVTLLGRELINALGRTTYQSPLCPRKRPSATAAQHVVMGHVWTVPAVQGESDYQRSVRVQPCIRPIVAWRITSVAMQPQWPLALM